MDKSTIKFKLDKYDEKIIFYEILDDGSQKERFILWNVSSNELKLETLSGGWKFFYEHNNLLLSFMKSPAGETLEEMKQELLQKGIEEI